MAIENLTSTNPNIHRAMLMSQQLESLGKAIDALAGDGETEVFSLALLVQAVAREQGDLLKSVHFEETSHE